MASSAFWFEIWLNADRPRLFASARRCMSIAELSVLASSTLVALHWLGGPVACPPCPACTCGSVAVSCAGAARAESSTLEEAFNRFSPISAFLGPSLCAALVRGYRRLFPPTILEAPCVERPQGEPAAEPPVLRPHQLAATPSARRGPIAVHDGGF